MSPTSMTILSLRSNELMHWLIEAPILTHYDDGKKCLLETDTFDLVVAEVFSQQRIDSEWHPVAYFSKTRVPAELNYPIHDKEMLPIIRASKHWHPELQSTIMPIEVLSDHKAPSARRARSAETLS